MNILLLFVYHCRIDEQGIIKVADFGLSEDIYERNYFKLATNEQSDSGPVKLPIKWMALESIHDRVFSEKSDVVSSTECFTKVIFTCIVVLWCFMLGSVQPWKDTLSWP